jgi:PBP1b-binding outer membrane lipoprotein LpoB
MKYLILILILFLNGCGGSKSQAPEINDSSVESKEIIYSAPIEYIGEVNSKSAYQVSFSTKTQDVELRVLENNIVISVVFNGEVEIFKTTSKKIIIEVYNFTFKTVLESKEIKL